MLGNRLTDFSDSFWKIFFFNSLSRIWLKILYFWLVFLQNWNNYMLDLANLNLATLQNSYVWEPNQRQKCAGLCNASSWSITSTIQIRNCLIQLVNNAETKHSVPFAICLWFKYPFSHILCISSLKWFRFREPGFMSFM